MTANYSNISDDWCDETVCPSTARIVLHIYYVVIPIYFSVALCIYTFILRCLYQLSKKRSGYYYQFALAISEAVEAFAIVFCTFVVYCTPSATAYWWAVVTGKVAYYLCDFAVLNTMLVSILNAIDRFLSMALPLKYRRLSSPAVRRTMVWCSICISAVLNTDDFVTYIVECSDDNTCTSEQNSDYKGSLTDTVVSITRVTILAVGTLTLIVANTAMLKLYRRRLQKVFQMTAENDAKNAVRKREESTLVTLTASQSLFVSLNISSVLSYYAVFRFTCDCCLCQMSVLLVSLDLMYMLVKLVSVSLCVVVNKIFREQLISDFSYCCSNPLLRLISRGLFVHRDSGTTPSHNRDPASKIATIASLERKEMDNGHYTKERDNEMHQTTF